MSGLNYHDEMVKNMINATYQGDTTIPKEVPVKIFTQEALEEHDKQIRADVINEFVEMLKEPITLDRLTSSRDRIKTLAIIKYKAGILKGDFKEGE